MQDMYNQAAARVAFINQTIQKLDLPQSFKQPFDDKGRPSQDYIIAYNTVEKSIVVENPSSSGKLKEAIGLSYELSGPILEKVNEKIADKVAATIVRKTLSEAGKFGPKAVGTFMGLSKGFSFVGGQVLGVIGNLLNSEEAGRGSSLTEQKIGMVNEALKGLQIKDPKLKLPEKKDLEKITKDADNTKVEN